MILIRFALMFVVLALTTLLVRAATFHRDGMCDDFRLVKRGNDLVIVCPTWTPVDWLNVKDIYLRCARVSASLVRGAKPMLTITCNEKKNS